MNKSDLILLLDVVKNWKVTVDGFADGYISTKYSRLQDELREMISVLEERIKFCEEMYKENE